MGKLLSGITLILNGAGKLLNMADPIQITIHEPPVGERRPQGGSPDNYRTCSTSMQRPIQQFGMTSRCSIIPYPSGMVFSCSESRRLMYKNLKEPGTSPAIRIYATGRAGRYRRRPSGRRKPCHSSCRTRCRYAAPCRICRFTSAIRRFPASSR